MAFLYIFVLNHDIKATSKYCHIWNKLSGYLAVSLINPNVCRGSLGFSV